MDFASNLVIDLFCITLLIVLLLTLAMGRRRFTMSARLFGLVIFSMILVLVADIFARMDGLTQMSVPIANEIGNFVLFLLDPIPSFIWVLFVIYSINNDFKQIKITILPLAAFYLIYLGLVIANSFIPIFYSIDANNVYQREPLFPLSLLWVFGPLVFSFVLTLIKRKEINTNRFNAFVFYPIAPFIGLIVALFLYGYSIVLPSITVGILLVFNSIQNEYIIYDYLTGAYNRRALEDYLRKRINQESKPFGAIMLDIDGYKYINDSYGHVLGDQALMEFAKILRQSIHTKDVVARYGGDEFLLVINCEATADLERVIETIRHNLILFNKKKHYPFKMGASKGYAMYDSSLTLEQFIIQLDNKMYEEKRQKDCISSQYLDIY